VRVSAAFDAVVARVAAVARADRAAWERDGWSRVHDETAGEPAAFVEWARDHRRWRFVVAEAADAVCAKPPEAAAYVLHEIVEELLEEDDEITGV
jgi:hypothetical protein